MKLCNEHRDDNIIPGSQHLEGAELRQRSIMHS